MKNLTRNYLKELYVESLEKVYDYFGTKGAFAILFLKISLAVIAVITLISLGFLKDNQPAYEIVFAIFSGDIVGLLLLWISSPFIAVWNMPKIAASRDLRQRERLEEIDPNLEKIVIEGYTDFFRKKVGLNIKNTTRDEFEYVIELVNLTPFSIDERCNEHPWSHPIETDNCHLISPTIKGNDHRVIDLAELRDEKIVFLTEKTTPMILNFFFIRPEPIPEPSYIKAYFSIEFEVRGILNGKSINRLYECLVSLNAEKNSNDIEASIDMSEVTRTFQKQKELAQQKEA